MSELQCLIGVERELSQVGWAVRDFAQRLGPAVIGAVHVTCSDEAEWECAEAFQRWFAAGVLPELKPACRAPFRSCNLGARYEWGAVRVAEEHFAVPHGRDGPKLLVVKINSHVAARQTSEGTEYGWLERYQIESACCGALAAMFDGADLPAIHELTETFAAGNKNRLKLLRDAHRVPAGQRALLAAVTNARLQAERAVHDIRQHEPHAPTVFLVLPCVSINRSGPDTELVVGQFGVDWSESEAKVKYRGLGDDPAGYRVGYDQGRLVFQDDHWPG